MLPHLYCTTAFFIAYTVNIVFVADFDHQNRKTTVHNLRFGGLFKQQNFVKL